jgi:hypothetical protein
MIPFGFSIDQIGIGPLFRLLKRPPAKDFDKRGKFHDWDQQGLSSSVAFGEK